MKDTAIPMDMGENPGMSRGTAFIGIAYRCCLSFVFYIRIWQ